MAETRKIAAILASDVVGFSRMASTDEDRTLARLRSLRAELIDPTVASQNGRVFKRTGDGALVEFRSLRFDGPRAHPNCARPSHFEWRLRSARLRPRRQLPATPRLFRERRRQPALASLLGLQPISLRMPRPQERCEPRFHHAHKQCERRLRTRLSRSQPAWLL